MPLPRVILVEDDPSVRRFVTLALDELPLTLVACETVAQALAELARGPACLVLTDLMLPGESGQALVERLQADPALRGPARVAVFSAGLTPAVRAQLDGLGVWRLLSKPVSLSELEGCVREAVAAASPMAGQPAGAPPPDGPRPFASTASALSSPSAGAARLLPRHHEAVSAHFGGDAGLYAAYRQSCLGQFALDRRQGEAALAAGDWPALRRLAHSLKTVLLTLGEPEPSQDAQTLEAVCATVAEGAAGAETAAAAALWQRVSAALQTLEAGEAPETARSRES